MAVNKVEYIKDSSVSGFASAGDEVTITNSSAPTISDATAASATSAAVTATANKHLEKRLIRS